MIEETPGLVVERPLEVQSDELVGQLCDTVDDFETFYEREYRRIAGLAYVLSGSWSTAEDLTQDTMVEVHRRWDRIANYNDPAGWARRVLINKQRSRVRRLTTEARALTRIGRRTEPALSLDPSSDHLFALVRRLPRRQAQAVALRYWDDYTIEQTALAMDCGPETVRTHLKRGMARLKELVVAEDDGGPDSPRKPNGPGSGRRRT